MQAIEFVTTAKAGKTIEMSKNSKKPTSPKKRKFKALKVKTKNLNFDRNEIYDE